MEKIVKSVKIGKTVYKVSVDNDGISASETVYPMPGYGNNYGTEYIIDLSYSKGWAQVRVECWNSTWATRGHGMTDFWTEATAYMRKNEAREFVKEVYEELKEAEDGTPDVKDVFDKVRDLVLEKCGLEDWGY